MSADAALDECVRHGSSTERLPLLFNAAPVSLFELPAGYTLKEESRRE
jgi:hypothetical protein